MRTAAVVLASLIAAGLLASEARAQGIDPELLMKWSGAQVVHYDVVGEYSRVTAILTGGSKGHWRETKVTDRFEVGFDWNPIQNTIVGKPVFKNIPSTVSNLFEGACQQPRVDGPYEHFDLVDAKAGYGQVELIVQRAFPGGASPYLNENHVCGLETLAPQTVTVTHLLPAIQGVFFVMPQSAPKHVRIGETVSGDNTLTFGTDGRTIVIDDPSNGWKHTYTLRIVK